MTITCDMCKYQEVCPTNSECVLVAKKLDYEFKQLAESYINAYYEESLDG